MKFSTTFFISFFFVSYLHAQNISFEEGVELLDLESTTLGINNPVVPFDYDNDGNTDLIKRSGVQIYKGIGGDEFEPLTDVILSGFLPLKAMDFDQDGDLDVIMQRYIVINESDDMFSTMNLPIEGNIVEVADFNEDGILDIVTHTNEDNIFADQQILLYSGQSDGTYLETILATGGVYGDLDIGDMDNDGDLDIVVIDELEDFPTMILTNDMSSFTAQNTKHLLLLTGSNLYLEDMDNDDDLDIILNDPFTGFYIIENNEDIFTSDESVFTFTQQISYFNIGDINNDGNIDLVYYGGNGLNDVNINAVMNMGNLEFSGSIEITSFPRPGAFSSPNANYTANNLSLYDYDSDGKLDIIYTDGFTDPNAVILYRNNTVVSSINELEKESLLFTISPNPASDYIEIIDTDRNLLEGKINYQIISINGSIVDQSLLENYRIPIKNLQKGTYLIKLENNKKTIRFIKI